MNKSGEKIAEIKHPFRNNHTLLSGNFSNGTFQFYYGPGSKKKEGDVGAFIVDPDSEELKDQIRYDLRVSKAEVFMGNLSDDNAVYSIISVRGSNTIRIANLNGEKDPEINVYTAPALLEKEFRNKTFAKGGYFLKKDPVVYAMKYLIKNYTIWEDKFFDLINMAMHECFELEGMKTAKGKEIKFNDSAYKSSIMTTPYIFIRFLSGFS